MDQGDGEQVLSYPFPGPAARQECPVARAARPSETDSAVSREGGTVSDYLTVYLTVLEVLPRRLPSLDLAVAPDDLRRREGLVAAGLERVPVRW
ncbi:MAG TPA: hypothetical protein VJT49_32035 [Amycolatopsis sp.]|uniref:hypothetical protein n=1 Tax=Amycolatopsis sp. TaxID=37632 RepID=UPI002B4899FF|nr:hypothetical protein [Amycolatopsis sp.]HKS49662.1 hypothetical protein [Amycolatopsis sp.]